MARWRTVWSVAASCGQTPEYGTAYAMARMQEMYVWDIGTRAGFIDFRGGQLEIHEFPYATDNEANFEENGVVIKSFPAIMRSTER